MFGPSEWPRRSSTAGEWTPATSSATLFRDVEERAVERHQRQARHRRGVRAREAGGRRIGFRPPEKVK